MDEPLLGQSGHGAALQQPGGITLEGNEVRSLQGSSLNSSLPLWGSERRWVRWPASVVHLTLETISSREKIVILLDRVRRLLGGSYINFLLVFLPLAIFSGTANWQDSVVFTLNFMALMPLEHLLNSVAEGLWLPFGQIAGTVLTIALPHIFPLIVRLYIPERRHPRLTAA
jgi:Ca2+:H+ antiporter